jgi:hypothetical protein
VIGFYVGVLHLGVDPLDGPIFFFFFFGLFCGRSAPVYLVLSYRLFTVFVCCLVFALRSAYQQSARTHVFDIVLEASVSAFITEL